MSSKKRKWSDEYVQYGFTCITERDESQRPSCMICNAKLSNSSLAPAKLREHFLKLHGDGQYKNTTLAEFKVKRARFDEKATLPVLGFVPINKPILTASMKSLKFSRARFNSNSSEQQRSQRFGVNKW